MLAIRAGTVPTAPSLEWLGGQHGEEEKVEDQVSGEKGREEDEAPEEEVGLTPPNSLRLHLTSMTASHGPAPIVQR